MTPTALGSQSRRPAPLARRAVLASLAALLPAAGCTVGPNYQAPQTAAPDAFGELAGPGAATRPTSAPPVVQWWRTFEDATLDNLIDRAVESNRDLRRARARVREARAVRDVTRADLFPTVNARGSYTYSRSPFGAFGGGVGGAAAGTGTGTGGTCGGTGGAGGGGTGGGGGGGGGTGGGGTGGAGGGATQGIGAAGGDFDFYQAGFDATWEIDVFGGVRREVEAADADVAAAVEDQRDVLVTLLGDVARSYVELRGYQRQITIAQENLRAQQETLELTRNRLRAGLDTDLSVAQSEAQVATTASAIPSLDALARQSIHRLGVLLGESPLALSESLSPPQAIPRPPPTVPVGVPSDLLRRRPDVRRAERDLAAATARIGAATADLFPRFSLTGSFGTQAGEAKGLFNYSNRFYSIGPSISWPVFDAGRIRANIRVQNAREEQALAAYEQTVLAALRDVEDALVGYLREEDRRRTLATAAEANRRAVDLANQLYNAGRTDFLNVLQAQRDLFASQDALVQSDRTVSTSLVALYKALGGGWQSPDPVPQETPPATQPAVPTASADLPTQTAAR